VVDRRPKKEKSKEPAADAVAEPLAGGDPASASPGSGDAAPAAPDALAGLADDGLSPDDSPVPFHLRFRLPAIGGVVFSVVWLAFAVYVITEQLPWSDLLSLLPHELGGMAAGVLTPVALVWMVVAFYERGRQLRRETEALRWHLQRLAYPSDRAERRVSEIAEILRKQARDLTRTSEEAAARAQAVTDQVRQRTLELARVSEDADLRAQAIAETLRRQTDDLQSVSEKATVRAREVGDLLFRQSHDLAAISERASTQADEASESLKRRSEELAGRPRRPRPGPPNRPPVPRHGA